MSPPAALRVELSEDDAGFSALAASAGFGGWSAAKAAGQRAAGGALLRAQLDGASCGYLLMSKLLDEAELLLVVVALEARGQGVGRALLDEAERWLRREGVRRWFLEVEADNHPAAALYARAGFLEVGARPDYYGAGRDARVLRLELQADQKASTP